MISVRMPNHDKLFDGLDAQSIATVRARAQNALAAKAKTLANKTARERYAVRADVLRKAMFVVKATRVDPVAELVVRGPRTKAGYFRITPAMPNPAVQRRRPGTGVRIFVKRAPSIFEHAFTARMPSGHIGVFRRDPTKFMAGRPKRPAIREQTVIGPSDMVNVPPVMDALRELIARESDAIYRREVAYALGTATASVRIEE